MTTSQVPVRSLGISPDPGHILQLHTYLISKTTPHLGPLHSEDAAAKPTPTRSRRLSSPGCHGNGPVRPRGGRGRGVPGLLRPLPAVHQPSADPAAQDLLLCGQQPQLPSGTASSNCLPYTHIEGSKGTLFIRAKIRCTTRAVICLWLGYVVFESSAWKNVHHFVVLLLLVLVVVVMVVRV